MSRKYIKDEVLFLHNICSINLFFWCTAASGTVQSPFHSENIIYDSCIWFLAARGYKKVQVSRGVKHG